ncbi:N-acetyl-1-D-myo-inositol-2-amino-2-deoxy-alpha-D-glucopyranoside deacetylase [Nocardia cyriacigeorgica]|uniref:N-acetyl-1-D-myo-inositol-2-amino-2-deoxy-alpha- D-glucopyranoside deacetylase n=1 Tax=Nocardia cyriacigeorgica TaxID=135487 RepID=UPI001893F964|nr:N-acetyl-1-D-myo-inositol-2-amino-2-deoxy-alpha-D-glucopyranoside deacetylase [Nocardia cyriacigeorgica]MBF6081709.1 N-acetyl-1-D-myo-inositol-2-amino-2-deoxy-alpha-D-glucopyranoside deacetylase [Nocardia cyriacigeorgica]MBF6285878.1 N-acetyl-1-D-myo-inositol-2-amino-2-deoxy-alpha-D-glucopyranoside deacetylase [Nocardia cyriacigeorgica]MBF6424527.1 N-acetyl-1-D-myo-inositol-2-amino-2-deoxy-alpha-D-glucopyranoside deacetylase [Nocardia cyriacigeorgica]BDU08327.1 1D-myo-inositol 2-acetamido-2-
MSAPATGTGGLLLVHAHPDDESITTGGTIAHYRRRGIPVTVVTCTLGEEGEVIGEQWAQLTADQADQLGGYRVLELTRALAALDAAPPRFLGGAGRWRDSGMAGTPSAEHPRAFVRSGPAAVEALTEILLELRPRVVVGYDPRGGYGHPDHVRAHEITTAAVAAAAERGWDTPKFYWTVTDADMLRLHTEALARRTVEGLPGALPAGWRLPAEGELACVPSSTVTTTVDVSDVLAAKREALRAHATQVTVAPSGREFALSNNIAQPVLPEEHFVLVRGVRGPVGPDGREHDLFAAPA